MRTGGTAWERPGAPVEGHRRLFVVAAVLLVVSVGAALISDGGRRVVLIAVAGALIVGTLVRRLQLALGRVQALERQLAAARRDAEARAGELSRANENLRGRNTELVAVQIAFADMLNLADERSDGRMRMLIESTGEELAELLEHQIDGCAQLDWPGGTRPPPGERGSTGAGDLRQHA